MNLSCHGSWETGRAPCHTHQGPHCLRVCRKPLAQGCKAAVPHPQRPSATPPRHGCWGKAPLLAASSQQKASPGPHPAKLAGEVGSQLLRTLFPRNPSF